MLKRLYIDNFRTLVNFELLLEPRTLLMGKNGAGKSTVGDVLVGLRDFIVAGSKSDELFDEFSLTRWQSIRTQRFEIEADIPEGRYKYVLVVEHLKPSGPDQPRTRIVQESLTLNSQPLLDFRNGIAQLYDDDFKAASEYPFDPGRSVLSTITPRDDNSKIMAFRLWVVKITVLRPNPRRMDAIAEKEAAMIFMDASNFVGWYSRASSADKRTDRALHDSLAAVLEGFEALNSRPLEPNRWLLQIMFRRSGQDLGLYLDELSDGQRLLILLYCVLHFFVAQGCTVWFDEPDNYVALDELQPWLNAATDIVDDGKGQLLIISHHPELYNQWAIDHGKVFYRNDCGPVRVRPFELPEDTSLTPAEAIARGLLVASDDRANGSAIPTARR